MGSLTLPLGSNVYVDAQIAIYTIERFPKYSGILQPMWIGAQAGEFTVVSSERTLLETLVLPLRNRNTALASDFENLWTRPHITLLPIASSILREAAQLRASIPALRTPDAIHAATALHFGCAVFVTNDHGFHRVPGLSLAVLDEVLAAP